jgi:flagellar biosynthesis/type III secretory pathway protein FliH
MAHEEGYRAGLHVGKVQGKQEAESARAAHLELLRTMTTLVSAVGQTLQATAQIFDNGSR